MNPAAFGITISRYGRAWAVYLAGDLLAVCLYLKGARCVAETLAHALALANHETRIAA